LAQAALASAEQACFVADAFLASQGLSPAMASEAPTMVTAINRATAKMRLVVVIVLLSFGGILEEFGMVSGDTSGVCFEGSSPDQKTQSFRFVPIIIVGFLKKGGQKIQL
jgi:hypothetical protein